MNINLMKHQKEFCRASYNNWLKNGRSKALFAEVGTGKTAMYLALALAVSKKKILIITTSFLKTDVAEKIKEYFDDPVPHCVVKSKKTMCDFKKDYAEYMPGEYKKNRKEANDLTDRTIKSRLNKIGKLFPLKTKGDWGIDDSRIIIINYEMIFPYIDELLKLDYDFIICDESHKLMTPSSKTSRGVMRLRRKCENENESLCTLVSTGTPSNGTLESLWAQMRFLGVTEIGETFKEFKDMFCVFGGFKGKQITGYQNKEELMKVIKENSCVIRTKDVLDLPEHHINKIYFELSDKHRKNYEKFRDDMVLELHSGSLSADNKLVLLGKLAAFTSGFQYMENELGEQEVLNLHDEKLKVLMDLMNSLENDSSVKDIIIWSKYTESQRRISDFLSKKKVKHLCLNGETKNKDKVLNDFRKTPVKVLLVNTSIAEGYTVVNSNVSIFYENSYNFIEKLQCRGRNYRHGQTEKVREFNILCKDTIDEAILEVLISKEKVSEKIMGPEDEVDKIFDKIFNEV